ncbi:2,3-diketo-L-gulonate TRAP transporter small permease protein yiaM [Oligella ureolytica]|uniref:TRAP transporter small permease protein n=3 Tax=Oligella ureolytica TaxID=90244 RepID=A0A378XBJ4_9BURK|nr:TRAP transporter small permease [Oligella ureolytica]QPT40409.1 TRAP transporter small permease [Oligella ureolytica]SUA51008.1 2,3-diketo-L-gulonate TRAP transporter small permease protein yiaM [Oligella ureolytica]
MQKITNLYFKLLKVSIVSCLVVMVIMVFTNVVMRYVFNSGLAISEELSRWAFVWLIFLGAILVLHENAHLGVDIFLQKVSRPVKKALLILSKLIMLVLTVLILDGSIEQTMLNLDALAPASGISQSWLFGVGIIFAVSTFFVLLYQLYCLIKTPSADIDSVMTKASLGAE